MQPRISSPNSSKTREQGLPKWATWRVEPVPGATTSTFPLDEERQMQHPVVRAARD